MLTCCICFFSLLQYAVIPENFIPFPFLLKTSSFVVTALAALLQWYTYRNSQQVVFYEKYVLKILPNSQRNTCRDVSFLIKLGAWRANLKKKKFRLWCLTANFLKLLEISDLWKKCEQLLLKLHSVFALFKNSFRCTYCVLEVLEMVA